MYMNFSERIEISDVSIKYKLSGSSGVFFEDCERVNTHMRALCKNIEYELNREFGYDLSFEVIGYEKGSVKVHAALLATWTFVTPIVQGYITNSLPSIASESEYNYNRICERAQLVTETVIRRGGQGTIYENLEITTTTRDIKDVCTEWHRK